MLRVILTIACVVGLSPQILAEDSKAVSINLSGAIVSIERCSATEMCQMTNVAGRATNIGSLVGTLSERIDVTDGSYSGTGVFATPNGDTMETEYQGQAFPPDQSGTVRFIESHVVTGGTGRFAGATGNFDVTGAADAFGALAIEGEGTLTRNVH